ncbi:SusC/RagA family TonB-linked outer membrane protein [Pedobacter sp. PWIIR3]
MKKYAFNPGMLRFGIPPKILLIMRLIIVLLTTSILQVSASTYGQQVTLNEKNVPLTTVFKEIRKQTGYDFLYSDKMMDDAKKVTIQLKNVTLETALELAFKNQQLSYTIENKMVTVKQKEKSFLDDIIARFQNINVRGRVVDSLGNGLSSATVKVKGGKSVSTNANGDFYLAGVDEKAVLVISNIGYKVLEIKRLKEELGDIKLEFLSSNLAEVTIVNKGYYNTDKDKNTGTISTFTTKDMEKQPINNILTALEGNIPGLQITQVSGVPGSELRVSLRGYNSLANGIDPLYIIDGIPFNAKNFGGGAGKNMSAFPSIRPEDIERIDVLKDADATAIYGSRGANGVILITTKKGKSGVTKIEASVYKSFSNVPSRLDLMKTNEYLQMRREGLKNDGLHVGDFDYDLNGEWDTTHNVNWQDEMFGHTAQTINAYANISGGNENTQFLFGLSYRKESTVFPGDYEYQVGSGILNFNHQSENKKFRADINLNYSSNSNRLPDADFTSNVLRAPNSPNFFNADGTLNWQNSTFPNPLAGTNINTTLYLRNLIANSAFSYAIIPELQIKTNIGYTINNGKSITLTPFTAFDPANSAFANDFRSNQRAINESSTWIIEPQMNYTRNFGFHHIDALFGGTFQGTSTETTSQLASGFSSDALIKNYAGATTITGLTLTNSEYKYIAAYARLGYNLNDRYIVNLTGRRDGSSRFGPGRRFGNFGSVGVAWIFSRENFIKDNLRFLSFGKIKGSLGKTGNDQLADYAYLSGYSPLGGSYGGTPILRPTNLFNPLYNWETINKMEGGIELGFFNRNLEFGANYYRHRTKNQLVGYSLPTVTGFDKVIANLPAVLQNTGLEFELNSINLHRRSFRWQTSLNINFPKNKLVSYPNLEGSSYAEIYAIGQPLTINYDYVYNGLDKETGRYTFADLNKDGEITTADRIPVFYGTKASAGINNTFSCSGFTLDFMFHFVKQIGYNGEIFSAPGNSNVNQQRIVLDRWRSPTQLGKYQKYTADYSATYDVNGKYVSSNATASNNSFVRLRNVMLSYTLPKTILSAIKMAGISVYAQGQNLFVISKFTGLDPETATIGLPPLRIYSFGVRASL